MKLKQCLAVLAILCFLIPEYSGAATVLDETGFIFGFSGENYSFVADQTSLVYTATLTDFEFPAAFNFLGVAITTSTDKIAELLAPGMIIFDVEFGATYFANIIGSTQDTSGAGLFGINIMPVPVPIPSTIFLFGFGLLGLAGVSRKNRNKFIEIEQTKGQSN